MTLDELWYQALRTTSARKSFYPNWFLLQSHNFNPKQKKLSFILISDLIRFVEQVLFLIDKHASNFYANACPSMSVENNLKIVT